ncbi:MAG: hypothetical protein OHK0013_03420 [Sandaracinaceae bacterium]
MDNVRTVAAMSLVPPEWEACAALVERAARALPHLSQKGQITRYRVFWPSGATLAFADVGTRSHLVVGRHERCDVRLEHPAIALRHCVLRARPTDDGLLELEGLDLGAELPFFVGPSVRPLRAFRASAGPVVLRVADAILVALPVAGPATEDESGLREPVLDLLEADPDRARPIPTSTRELEIRTLVESSYRTMARPTRSSLPVEQLPASRGPTWARVALRGPSGRVVQELSRAELESLVLVGRYPRCQRGSLAPFSDRVSRVHAGLVASGDVLDVLDLASTNGIGERHGETVRLARRVQVRSRASIALGEGGDRLDIELV